MASNVIYADFPAHRDPDICQVANRIWSPYQKHTQGRAIGIFSKEAAEAEMELRYRERQKRIKGRTPQPEGI